MRTYPLIGGELEGSILEVGKRFKRLEGV